jgi:hypothetical protein
MHERFRDGRDPWNLYRIGPHRGLVGRPVSELNLGPMSPCVIECPQVPTLRDWQPNDRHAPCVLSGAVEVKSDDPSPQSLAITLHGMVQAVTKTRSDRSWQAAVPEHALREGDNGLQIFVLDDSAEGLLLRPASLR